MSDGPRSFLPGGELPPPPRAPVWRIFSAIGILSHVRREMLIFVFVIWGLTIFFVVVMGFLIFASRQGAVFTRSESRGPGSRGDIWSVFNLILSLAELVGGGGGGRGGSSDGGGFSGGGGDSGGGGASGSW